MKCECTLYTVEFLFNDNTKIFNMICMCVYVMEFPLDNRKNSYEIRKKLEYKSDQMCTFE